MADVKPGIAVLAERGWDTLRGLRIGLVTNPTGVLPDGKTTTIDALRRADGVKLAALFGPEHGVRGDIPAGKYVASYTDKRTGLPVYSLYGRTKSPTAAMLNGLDALVFDIQDIGCRSYTYLSTLGGVLDGAGRHGIPVIVCDRPNPLGGRMLEGGPVRPGYKSFISQYPVAYRHGMTLGEAARFLVGRGLVRNCEVRVVACAGLTRALSGWSDLGGLPWIPTSPNVPTADAAVLYAATGIIGELGAVSIGIGTDAPFGYCGAPGVDAERLAQTLQANPSLAGIAFAAATWIPRKGTYAGKRCAGVRLRLASAPADVSLCAVNFYLLDGLRRVAPRLSLFADRGLFDYACGTGAVRQRFQRGDNAAALVREFDSGRDAFAEARKPYLLYS